MTATCPISGDAMVERTWRPEGDSFRWIRADLEVHVSTEMLDQLDEAAMAFLTAKYEIGEPCTYWPGTRHARRRDI